MALHRPNQERFIHLHSTRLLSQRGNGEIQRAKPHIHYIASQS